MTAIVFVLVTLVTAAALAKILSTRSQPPSTHMLSGPVKRVPNPSARDLHTVTSTLGHAPVPSWT